MYLGGTDLADNHYTIVSLDARTVSNQVNILGTMNFNPIKTSFVNRILGSLSVKLDISFDIVFQELFRHGITLEWHGG
jgi:hypothetical protein